ncbi:MAG: YybS family protein [Trichlorobacter sp.]|uniref:YybS family protein n=1 Tax=Trichlorobacter sp. TaxID=2911007 RepID=UPI002563050C|nr:YybS family protein [Trichlorobacter sp.]MDK9719122.1 YybS family protein [Trichlorobacter sp.]
MQANGGQKLAAVLIGTLGSGLLFSASLAVPILGFVSAFLAPVPLGLARIKGGSAVAGFSALLATLLLAILFSPPIGAWYVVQCGLTGLLVPELALKGFRPSRTIIWTTAAGVTLTALVVAAFVISNGINLQLFIQKEITDGINQATRLYEQHSGLPAQDIEVLKQGMQTVGQIMSRIYPALITINLGLINAVMLLLFTRTASKQALAVNLSPFKEFRTPYPLVWLLIVAGFTMLAPSPLLTTPALNILSVLGVLYFMQGLAVLLTTCERSSFASTLKVLLGVILLTQPYLTVVVTILGIFDYWGDFRTPRTTQEENL